MSEHIYLISMSLIFGTILLIFGMKYVASVLQSWARLRSEHGFRDLSDKVQAAQSENAAALAAINHELSKVSAKLIAVEKILKEVE